MGISLVIFGIVLLTLAAFDIFMTVITTRGGGPVATLIGRLVWRAVLAFHRWRPTPKILAFGGPVITVLTVLSWMLLPWAGWLLVFAGGGDHVFTTSTHERAGFWDLVYFTGYSLFTLGIGDFRPEGPVWQVLTIFVVASGFLIISLSASYVIPLVSAATARRGLAAYIGSLGNSPELILINAWNGKNFSGFEQHLVNLTPLVNQLAHQTYAYPVLHYFQTSEAGKALPVQLAALSEALTLLENGVAPEHRLPVAVTRPMIRSITAFLQTKERFIARAETAPAALPLAGLRKAGIPVVSESQYARFFADMEAYRRDLRGLVDAAGWRWDNVTDAA